ncbi:MAG TPA: coproporphyrinogen dehydrogenase HemZ, partial [Desulfobacteria bacterium]|nr:coproporphyrinogen dehydrogenase HemZ [Desulfobacteria bacterium]
KVSVYIGIPFCPTRCAYCSFPAFSAGSWGTLMKPFLTALEKEIREIGDYLNKAGRTIQTIYIGGGTPTVLDSADLRNMLLTCSESLASSDTTEVTLEAGRPDTITTEKLQIAREFGVTRISINPQTMNGETLKAIGRCHAPEDVVSAFNLARGAGFDNINMDIILGLPGENSSMVEDTLVRLSRLGPENLTVHTLAVKRASHIKEAKETYSLPSGEEVSRMLEITAGAAASMQMKPYYLYRQKKMVGPYENIGYAVPGRECLYNIQIIEERQTIVGMGGGAGSKFVEPGTWYLTSHYNPKDPHTYINRIDEIINRKKGLLHKLFTRITL